ncbi:MAG: hypothetical protein QOJ75_1865, partial [Chloroflexota bacterium]|nr:hypothetical protein [Chloroflexota bacterium]
MDEPPKSPDIAIVSTQIHQSDRFFDS